MSYHPLRVECYAGYRAEETPRRFYFGWQRIELSTVIDRWLTPEHRYFKVKGDDGRHYLLRYATQTRHWEASEVKSQVAKKQD
jgi:hypothetical protein